jgi:hypothetical protein
MMPELKGLKNLKKFELYRNQLDALPPIAVFEHMDEFMVVEPTL